VIGNLRVTSGFAEVCAFVINGVLIQQGQTEVTAIPRGFSSTANARENRSINALLAAYTLKYGRG